MAPWLVCRVATDVGDVIAPLWQKSQRGKLGRLNKAEGTNVSSNYL